MTNRINSAKIMNFVELVRQHLKAKYSKYCQKHTVLVSKTTISTHVTLICERKMEAHTTTFGEKR